MKTSEEVAKQLKLCGGHSGYPFNKWWSEDEVNELFARLEDFLRECEVDRYIHSGDWNKIKSEFLGKVEE